MVSFISSRSFPNSFTAKNINKKVPFVVSHKDQFWIYFSPCVQTCQELLRGLRPIKRAGAPDDVIIKVDAEQREIWIPEQRLLLPLSKTLLFGKGILSTVQSKR